MRRLGFRNIDQSGWKFEEGDLTNDRAVIFAAKQKKLFYTLRKLPHLRYRGVDEVRRVVRWPTQRIFVK